MFSKTNFKFFFSFTLIILTLSLILGCAAKKQFWGNEKTGFILNYNLPRDQVWTYHTTTKQISAQEIMGQTNETSTDIKANYSISGAGLDEEKNLISSVKMDSITMVTKSAQGEMKPDFTPIIGKSFGLTFSPKGKKVSFSDPETTKVDFGPMAGKRDAESFFKNLFPRLPNKPVKMGETWTVNEERTEPQGGLNINIKTESVNTLVGFETVEDIECLKITTKTTGTLDGTGNQMGADVNFEGDLEGTTSWYFAYKNSAFIKSNSEIFVEGNAAVTGPQNLTIPITQETKTEARLLK